MNEIQEIISFSGSGMDVDSDILTIPKGASRYRLNVIEKDGDLGVLTNVLGNTQINELSIPAGTNRVQGFVEDQETKTGIAFVYNSNGDHCIIAEDAVNETAWFILRGSDDSGAVGDALNFQNLKYIDAAIIGNGNDRYLIWTDGVNPPRLANITMMVNYTDGVGTPAYTSITSDIISFYKKPPSGIPTVAYQSESKAINNLTGKLFEFALRFKYYDNTYSVLSPPGEIQQPDDSENGQGIIASKPNVSNVIYVYANTDEWDPDVADFQLCYRIVDQGDGVSSSWYLANIDMELNLGVQPYFRFYNDTQDLVLADADTSRFYDYVPDLVDHLTVIDSNRAVLAGITEGYDNIADTVLDVSFTVDREDTGLGGVVGLEGAHYISHSETLAAGASMDFYVTKATTDDRYYCFILNGTLLAISERFELTYSYNLTSNQVATYFEGLIDALIDIAAVATSDYVTITNNTAQPLEVYAYALDNYTKPFSHKSGSREYYGLQYYKNGKPWAVQTNDSFIVDIPYLYEALPTYTYTNFRHTVEWEINHLPPATATHYQWVYLGNNIDYYETYCARRVTDFTYEGNYTKISKSIAANFKDAYGGNINYGMDVQPGDRVRFIGYFWPYTDTSTLISDGIKLYDDLYDFEVLAVDSTDIYITNFTSSFLPGLDGTDSGIYICLEIYRPKVISTESGSYKTIGPVYETNVVVGVNTHGTTSGFFTPYYANAVMGKQVFVNANNIANYSPLVEFAFGWIEMYSMSVLYPSAVVEFGKENYVNKDAKTQYYSRLAYGGKFFDNSGVNYMTKFEFDGVRDYDDRNGLVTKLEQIGNTLNVYQENKITSFYLGATYATDPNGNETTAFSDNVMSIGRQSELNYGCTHFTSYVKSPKQAYFFDLNNACVLKDTPGGIISINAGMDNYFASMARFILTYEDPVHIFGGWNEDYKLYFISFVDLADYTAPVNQTLAYYEDGGYWMSFYSFKPEMYGKTSGNKFLSFLSGQCWVHDINTTMNNFHGAQSYSVVHVHATQNPTELKVYNAIEISSTGQWSAPNNGDIAITKPMAMSSRLKAGRFDRQEGVYRSDFLRDITTTGTAVTDNLFNGRSLRGNEMTIKLTNTDTTQAELNYVMVNSSVSK